MLLGFPRELFLGTSSDSLSMLVLETLGGPSGGGSPWLVIAPFSCPSEFQKRTLCLWAPMPAFLPLTELREPLRLRPCQADSVSLFVTVSSGCGFTVTGGDTPSCYPWL